MSRLPLSLRDHLAGAATTVCTCWIVRRTDGTALGFTDHDRPLTIEGTLCAAATGLGATQAANEQGFASDTQDVEGVLTSASISRADVEAGRYDGARVEEWLVDWSDPASRARLRTGILGPLSLSGDVFRAELRGLTSLLDRSTGRSLGRHCDAVLGDARCGVDLTLPGRRAEGTVSALVDDMSFEVSGIDTDAFRGGSLQWLTGQNAGRAGAIVNRTPTTPDTLRLFDLPPAPFAVGDRFMATVGCDRTFASCRDRYSNVANFRGFPHMPGEDFAIGYADTGSVHDGSPLIA